jgi:hypothetical protein
MLETLMLPMLLEKKVIIQDVALPSLLVED